MDSSSFISFFSAYVSSAKYESQQEQPYLYIGFGEDQMYMKVHFKQQTDTDANFHDYFLYTK